MQCGLRSMPTHINCMTRKLHSACKKADFRKIFTIDRKEQASLGWTIFSPVLSIEVLFRQCNYHVTRLWHCFSSAFITNWYTVSFSLVVSKSGNEGLSVFKYFNSVMRLQTTMINDSWCGSVYYILVFHFAESICPTWASTVKHNIKCPQILLAIRCIRGVWCYLL